MTTTVLNQRETYLMQEVLWALDRNFGKDKEMNHRLIKNALDILQLAQNDAVSDVSH